MAEDQQTFEFKSIGIARSCYIDRFGTPRQSGLAPSSWATIELHRDLNLGAALKGLDGFSHIWLIFIFHRNENRQVRPIVFPPRLQGKKAGLFSTRSPHRPNPIGLSCVRLEKIEGHTLWVSGVDFIDGTPILDIKPYLPQVEALPDARAGWVDKVENHDISSGEKKRLQVEFSKELEENLPEALKNIIRETLELDPRPVFYREKNGEENPYMDTYGFYLENFNVVYRMTGKVATVLRLEER